MASLLGSPLGLTTITSNSNSDGFSTFYGGQSDNINVVQYNNGTPQSIKIDGDDVVGSVSLFTGKRVNRFFPNIGRLGSDRDTTGLDNKYNGINRNELHNDDVYDTSIINIIEKLSPCPRAALKAQDFAYLKNLGVFPNNRLMIARRFHNPVKDNIMDTKGSPPKSVLISWKPEGQDFLTFSFGEEWDEAGADFTEVINGLGGDFIGGKFGSKLESGMNSVPLPGFTEIWQRKLFEELGILKEGAGGDLLPSGNPNIIKQAKKRKTIAYGNRGSGLKCVISILMEVEYEQKFISGIDPTIAWMDILSNSLSFGTSNSSTYGLSENFGSKLDAWTSDPSILLENIMTSLENSFLSVKEEIRKIAEEFKAGNLPSFLDKIKEGFDFQKAVNVIGTTIKSVVRKYKIEIIGIANSLSGAPSTPWHITIGNPLRPIFSSGDMLTEDVSVTLGSTLAFNDLPSTIKVSFTLKNARPLGMQEILAKFNNGHLRITQIKKDFVEKEDLVLQTKSEKDEQDEQRQQEILKQTTGVAAPAKSSIPNSSVPPNNSIASNFYNSTDYIGNIYTNQGIPESQEINFDANTFVQGFQKGSTKAIGASRFLNQ